MSRPPIPADIRRAVLVESGHRCAIPHCGQTELDVHHIIPWETCQKHEYSNLITLCVLCHRRVHSGQIDRKSLFIYKQRLIDAFGAINFNRSDSEVIEVKRRISEVEKSPPGYYFEFDFPDFSRTTEKIVSKNIEAWGYELLTEYHELQEANARNLCASDDEGAGLFNIPSTLKGDYRVVRRDDQLISLKYTIDRYYTGAAHGGRATRVQNFLLKPFSPITLQNLTGDLHRLDLLADLVRKSLSESGRYDAEWLEHGTESRVENFDFFVIERYGLRFIFREYQICCYAEGEQELWIPFSDLSGICDPMLINRLEFQDVANA